MSFLPVEDPNWLEAFKAKIRLERAIIRKLIQWGFTDSAFEIHRTIEERFNAAVESLACQSPPSIFHLPHDDRAQIKQILREHYQKIREFPRRRNCRELMQRGLLTGFEELGAELIQLYEEQFQRRAQGPANKRAA